jgi:hypothetical protein
MTYYNRSPYLRDVALVVSLLRAYVYIFAHTKSLPNCVVGWFLDDGPESLEADSLLVDGFCSDGLESLEADSQMTYYDRSPYLRDVALVVSLLRAYVYIFAHTKSLPNCVVSWFLCDGPESLEADSLLVDGFCSDGPESREADSLLVRTFCGEDPSGHPAKRPLTMRLPPHTQLDNHDRYRHV